MTDQKTNYKNVTPDSLAAEMKVEVFANKEHNEIIIMHAEPFGKILKELEYEPDVQLLHFVFDDGTRKELGVALKDVIASIMKDQKEIGVALVDIHKGQTLGGDMVPLKILNAYDE